MDFNPYRAGATVIPFPDQHGKVRRLTPHDQAEAFAWERAMCRSGYAQVSLEEAGSTRPADRLIVYYGEELWIVQSMPPGRQFGLWHRASGVRLGNFPSVWTALEAIPLDLSRSEPGLQGDGWMPELVAAL